MASSFMQFILKPYTEFHHSIFSCLQQRDGNWVRVIPWAPEIWGSAAVCCTPEQGCAAALLNKCCPFCDWGKRSGYQPAVAIEWRKGTAGL